MVTNAVAVALNGSPLVIPREAGQYLLSRLLLTVPGSRIPVASGRDHGSKCNASLVAPAKNDT